MVHEWVSLEPKFIRKIANNVVSTCTPDNMLSFMDLVNFESNNLELLSFEVNVVTLQFVIDIVNIKTVSTVNNVDEVIILNSNTS